MTRKTSFPKKQILLLLFSLLLLTACNGTEPETTPEMLTPENGSTPVSVSEATSTPTSLTLPTTDPSIPLAASVNGQGIWLEDYQAEIQRAQATPESGLITFSEDVVLQNLIDETLLMQGAAETGYIPNEATIQERITQLGGSQNLQDWLVANNYTQDSFERALARSIAAAWMRDYIIKDVPSTAEQVHARQILLYNSDEAESVYAQLQDGTDFATLASEYDPLASGELGWFPRGYLTVPALDEPIFALQAGEYTNVIETVLGFHIIQVIEREAQHPLSPGAYQALQVQAVQHWLTERRNQSNIQILLP